MPRPWTFAGLAAGAVALRCVLVAVNRSSSDFEELWIIAIGAMILAAVSAWGWRKTGKGALVLVLLAGFLVGAVWGYSAWERAHDAAAWDGARTKGTGPVVAPPIKRDVFDRLADEDKAAQRARGGEPTEGGGLWMTSAKPICDWQAAARTRAAAAYEADPRVPYALPLMGPVAPAGYDEGLWRSFAETWDADIRRGVVLKGAPGSPMDDDGMPAR